MRLFTIGFTKKSAEKFFETLRASGTRGVVDVRLSNVSQLAGFAKKQDLAYFLDRICGLDYVHEPLLAPSPELFHAYRGKKIDWSTYEKEYLKLIAGRRIEEKISPQLIADGCLLCTEDQPHHCHRRLVAEYLDRHWGDVAVTHLR
jgi:uncharacterized protein (DUF488 family)